MLPLGLDVSNPQISPDGKLLLFTATVAGQQSLYLYPIDPDAGPARRQRRPWRRRPAAVRRGN